MGRWITPDPQGFDDGPNLYAYLNHSPLLAFDLYGLEKLSKLEDTFTWDEKELSSNHFHNLNQALKDSSVLAIQAFRYLQIFSNSPITP